MGCLLWSVGAGRAPARASERLLLWGGWRGLRLAEGTQEVCVVVVVRSMDGSRGISRCERTHDGAVYATVDWSTACVRGRLSIESDAHV